MSDFGHHIQLASIRDGDRLDLVADEAERQAVKDRLGLAGLERLDAHVVLSRDGEAIHANGRVQAALNQSCVITGEPVAALVDEAFELAFLPEPDGKHADDEVELGEEECDVIFHDGAVIDLGSAIADTLALNLDPYPRSAGADAALKEAGIMTEEEASPFAALAALKRDNPET